MENRLNKNKKPRSLTTYLWVVGIIAIIVVNIIIWKNYFGDKSEIEGVNSEIALVEQQIAQAAQPSTNLESELAKARSDLAAALEVFPEKIDRTDVIDFVITTAEMCDVQVIPLVSEGLKMSNTGQSYMVLQYSGTVIGKLNNATNFITMLRNGDYSTIIITECTVERITAADSDVSGGEIEVTIDITFELYATSILESKDAVL
jgi:limonene-1,2-epoxide hydrolase